MLLAVAGMIAAIVILLGMHRRLPVLRSARPVSKTGLFEGFWLVAKRPYLRSVLVISTSYLIIQAFADYQMHYLAVCATIVLSSLLGLRACMDKLRI